MPSLFGMCSIIWIYIKLGIHEIECSCITFRTEFNTVALIAKFGCFCTCQVIINIELYGDFVTNILCIYGHFGVRIIAHNIAVCGIRQNTIDHLIGTVVPIKFYHWRTWVAAMWYHSILYIYFIITTRKVGRGNTSIINQ